MLTSDASTRMQPLLYSSRFFETIRTGILVQDLSGAVIDCNPAAARLLGLAQDSFADREHFDPWHGAVREDGTRLQRDELPTTLTMRTGDTQLDVVMGVDLPGQIRRWLSVDTYQLTVDGVVHGIVSAFDDIDTQWHERHLLKLLAEVNRVVMSTSDESESLQHLCTTLVEKGPYALAWIGVEAEDGDRTIEIRSSAGAAEYLYEGMTSSSVDSAIGNGPSGVAMRTNTIQVASDLSTHEGFEPWRERASQFGLASSVAIPFAIGDQRAGLFIYASETNAFDDATVRGLDQIAKEVGFGVAYVRSVRKSESALEADDRRDQRAARDRARTVGVRAAIPPRVREQHGPDVLHRPHDRIIAVNDAFCEMVGLHEGGADRQRLDALHAIPTTSASPRDPRRLISAAKSTRCATSSATCRKDGRIIVVEVSRSAARDADGKILYFVLSERDITEERALAAQLSHQALHDPLTGLANRALFEDRLAQAHARVVRQGGIGAVLLLDLDDFKGVNDTHGHLVGDQLLIGDRASPRAVTRSTDTLCRFGGDEFLYLAEGLGIAARGRGAWPNACIGAIAEPFSIGGLADRAAREYRHRHLGCRRRATVSEFVQNADAALYEAKRQRRGTTSSSPRACTSERSAGSPWSRSLRQALCAGELVDALPAARRSHDDARSSASRR